MFSTSNFGPKIDFGTSSTILNDLSCRSKSVPKFVYFLKWYVVIVSKFIRAELRSSVKFRAQKSKIICKYKVPIFEIFDGSYFFNHLLVAQKLTVNREICFYALLIYRSLSIRWRIWMFRFSGLDIKGWIKLIFLNDQLNCMLDVGQTHGHHHQTRLGLLKPSACQIA